jgi:formylmethanofuran dehydrogenase subunit E
MAKLIEKCTMCGEKCKDITVVDDVTRVCPDCLEDEFFKCEECNEYWLYDAKEYVELDDGRIVCEDCAEELE